jgi:hypothetical protein
MAENKDASDLFYFQCTSMTERGGRDVVRDQSVREAGFILHKDLGYILRDFYYEFRRSSILIPRSSG